MNHVHLLPREGYERPANLGSAKANGEKDKVVSYSMCEGYLVFQFQNLDSKMFTVSFLFLLCGNICVPHKAFAAKLSSYLPIHTYNTGPQHLHLGLFLSSVTCAFYKCRPAHFPCFAVCLSSILLSICIFLSSTHCSISP